MTIAAQELENGNAELGLVGTLGNGTGKWRLKVTSNPDLKVQGLMNTRVDSLRISVVPLNDWQSVAWDL